ncbi:hypothetical protein SAMN05216237_1230 [Pseudomonas yamanorum]|nr:hypothetical protein SAMN05216237_1230 [Pseudomonas yamanorum]
MSFLVVKLFEIALLEFHQKSGRFLGDFLRLSEGGRSV